MSAPRVAVIGAGIAGVAMTHALRGVGFAAELFEQTDAARTSGYQINVLPNGIHALSQLGLLAPLRASGIGSILRSAPVYDGLTGRFVRRIRTVFDATGEYAGISCFRGDLHRVLLGAIRRAGPSYGQAVRRIERDRGVGGIAVEFSDGRIDRFDLVIGADGVSSAIRQQLFPGHPVV